MSEATETGDPELMGRRVAGKFLIEKFLGGGAMGAVYRAKDTTLDRHVALKVMHPSVAVDPSFVKRFHREARAASRVDHANAMRVIEFGEEPDGLLYIAMEYLQGRDLYKVIHEDWPISEARTADIMAKALAAMAVAHDMGVIHRDLKPENIMILERKDDEGHDIVKVCDFGIAKIADADDEPSRKGTGAKLTTSGLVVGTPEYMSPEQARGEKLDARSDLYSMGIILYQLLTGRVPFIGDTALSVVLKHITDIPEPPSKHYPNVHKGLETVCMKALAKAREERWQSAREMRTAIRAAMDGRALPVDTRAVTEGEGMPSVPQGAATSTIPTPSRLGSQPMPVPPTAQSTTTPLGTSIASDPAKKSGARRCSSGSASIALVVGGASFVLFVKPKLGHEDKPVHDDDHRQRPRPPSPAKSADPTDPSVERRASPSPSSRASTRPRRRPATNGHPRHHGKTPVDPSAAPSAAPPPRRSVAAPEPAPAPTPAPQPPPPPVTVAAPAPAAPPPPPPWSAASCKATLGARRSTSGYNVKDLTLSGTDVGWTGCAKSSIASKPAGPIAATVRLKFNDNRGFRGAACTTGCDAPLAACIAAHTSGASIQFRGGDETGEPEFEVQATFTCD